MRLGLADVTSVVGIRDLFAPAGPERVLAYSCPPDG